MAPPTNTETLNTLYTTTWYAREDEIIDQVFNSTPFWYELSKSGNIRSQRGGRQIEQPLRYGQNSSPEWIGKGDTIDIVQDEIATVAHFDWKHLTGHVVRYYTDVQMNQGDAKLIDMVNMHLDVLRDSLISEMSTALFGDGTGGDGKIINGLDNLVPEDPTTGTVGERNRATYSWWRPQYYDMTAKDVTVHLRKRMDNMFNTCGIQGRGLAKWPTMLITTQDVYESYNEEAYEMGRITIPNKGLIDLGFGDLAFRGVPIVWDPECLDYSMFFLNMSFLHFVYDPISYFRQGPWRPLEGTPDDHIVHNLSTCNLTMSNAPKQGRLFNIGN